MRTYRTSIVANSPPPTTAIRRTSVATYAYSWAAVALNAPDGRARARLGSRAEVLVLAATIRLAASSAMVAAAAIGSALLGRPVGRAPTRWTGRRWPGRVAPRARLVMRSVNLRKVDGVEPDDGVADVGRG